MKTNFLIALCLFVIFISCGKNETPLISSETESNESGLLYKKDKDKGKEIKGTLNYKYTTDFDLSCYTCGGSSFSGGNYFGGGKLSQIGSITSKTKACVAYIMSGTNVIGVHIDNQCCSFVDEDGDELYLTNDAYDLYINSSGVATGTCNFYFAGGTGDYKKAKGSFKGYVENSLKGYFKVYIEGTLKY